MSPSAEASSLQIRDVGVSFDGVRALDGVTFSVDAGGVTAVIGPNGAGKTTLLNCVSGLYRHTGDVVLGGASLSGLAPHRRARRGLARTFQTPALVDELPVVDNVMLGAAAMARPEPERRLRERALELIARLGADAVRDQPAGSLSHGDRRRAEIARALLPGPALLLLDEPAAGLDHDEAMGLLTAVLEICGTCVLVEHDVELVMKLARHVVVLDTGRVLAEGPPTLVVRDQKVIDAYLGQEIPG
ncbi:MAG TPA: ATP-binding cassette domain-containing protein [Amycolatopsis sp.]|uniref:ABC transporter ATP-binding protein n=1 Tax=Amycolatopsis sp. TaxID=37632 RepID=UPI002B49E97D|nr:ATP-binding cassette domain-containing protein [Amycolatopsis sp.]HKS47478.1 ATP-binding cassette domain-containing protein [Amycolatopsis sp.]